MRLPRRNIACFGIGVILISCRAWGVIVNGSGQVTASGSDLGLYLGADRFYASGYTGSRATLASIEGFIPWVGHQSLTHVGIIPPSNGVEHRVSSHPTGVVSVMVARGNRTLDRGIAYNASLYAGAVAYTFSGELFGPTYSTSGSTYARAAEGFTTVANPSATVSADVINSSWGFTSAYSGFSQYTSAMDAIAARSGKLFVNAAGNSGPNSNTLADGPASMLNGMTVASLASSAPAEISPCYDTVSTFSSRSPSVIYLPGIGDRYRAGVSLAAPGENFSVAGYNGTSTPANWYYFNSQGTSYAAPTVAGGAALLVDVGYDRFVTPTDRGAVDGRVMKAVLMNSASKTVGWDNGQTLVDGVIRTTQGVDWAVGAGRLNLAQAFDQYTVGSPGLSQVANGSLATPGAGTGWTFDSVSPSSPLDSILLTPVLSPGTNLTATLTWFSENTYNNLTAYSTFDALANLSLEVWSEGRLVAVSDTSANTVEHLCLTVPLAGQYELRVRFVGMDFGTPGETPYGLAWSAGMIPDPGGLMVGMAGLLMLTRRGRRGM